MKHLKNLAEMIFMVAFAVVLVLGICLLAALPYIILLFFVKWLFF